MGSQVSEVKYRGKAAGGYVLNSGVRQYLNRATARMREACERCDNGRAINAAVKIRTALGELENAERKLTEFEQHGELIAMVYAMRYRDGLTIQQIALTLRGMHPAYWLTMDQVEYLLQKERKCIKQHRNVC